jgi:hypothetical protein
MVDSRKWLLSKLIPAKFGDKLDIGHSDGDALVAAIAAGRKRALELP